MISTPACEASSCTLTTIACCAWTGEFEALAPGTHTATAATIVQTHDLCGERIRLKFSEDKAEL
jgi:hypothetical protein